VSRAIAGSLSVKNGTFQYAGSDSPVFDGINIAVSPGESMAIFGPSGCGKSTLIKTMQGLVPLDKGELRVDGLPLCVVGVDNLRAQSASVMQGDDLLSGSLLENIAFGEISPDIQQVYQAASLALIHDDILHLPMAYESIVGEMGASLSAGQIQRLLIARALYRQPQLLFLDEGTAHLDAETPKATHNGRPGAVNGSLPSRGQTDSSESCLTILLPASGRKPNDR
jgi:ATP-binding cassette subfamily B protein RaxB